MIVRRLLAREQGIKAENKHGGTYGMLRDGEDKVFGELWRKAGPQARTNNFLMGALPRYGGHISADVQWAKKLDTLTAPGPQGLGSSNSTLDLFQSRTNTPSTLLRLQQLQLPDQQLDAYVSTFDKKAQKTQSLIVEQKLMCPWVGKKHHVPGYAGHIPFLTQHVIGGTYSLGSVTAFEATHKRHATGHAAGRFNAQASNATLDLSWCSEHTETLRSESTLPEFFLQQREANSRTQSNPILKRLASRLTPQVRQALQELCADHRGYVAGLFVKATLMDFSKVVGMSDLEIRDILYQLDKTGAGEVLEHDLLALLHNQPVAPALDVNSSTLDVNASKALDFDASILSPQSHVQFHLEGPLARPSTENARYLGDRLLGEADPIRADCGTTEMRAGFQRAATELQQRLGSSFENARQALSVLDIHASGVYKYVYNVYVKMYVQCTYTHLRHTERL